MFLDDLQTSNAVYDWSVRGGTVFMERVEYIVGEIENPANIELVALADFLALRTWDSIL